MVGLIVLLGNGMKRKAATSTVGKGQFLSDSNIQKRHELSMSVIPQDVQLSWISKRLSLNPLCGLDCPALLVVAVFQLVPQPDPLEQVHVLHVLEVVLLDDAERLEVAVQLALVHDPLGEAVVECDVPEDAVGLVADALRHPRPEAAVVGGHQVVGEVGRLLQGGHADVVLDEEHADCLRHVSVQDGAAVLGP